MNQSLRSRLLALILISFVLGWLIISGFAWWRATAQANALFDNQLAQLADLIAVITTHEAGEQDLHQFESDLQQSAVHYSPLFQVWSAGGRLLVRGPQAPSVPLSANANPGYSDETLDSYRLRVYTRYTADKMHRIQVAQEVAGRQAQLHAFVRGSLTPLLLALPMIGLLWFAIERALAPLKRLAKEIGSRTPGNLEPIAISCIPKEVSVLVDSINGLLGRLHASLERYSRFTADAAHELRTPLAGSVTQIHAALDSTDAGERRDSLRLALNGLSRLHHLLEQLLLLARLEPDAAEIEFATLDLNALAVEVASEYAPRAMEKEITFELLAPEPVVFKGVRELIAVALRNLLDNAVRATAPGGKIILSLQPLERSIRLQVEDTGSGIPDQEKARVFERFHRLPDTKGEGSGLGLSIVKSAVALHGGSISLQDREPGQGLRIMIEFPIKTKS
ncbi:MAG: sensor histidine kinase N-terminal domain-containing protein [Gammaproteobacteria bacterium]|nr:sensor histidine kinase N-terminal domain-containing protein [Gammaproteobacteria bacterium]